MKMVIESNPETDMLGNEDLDMDIISNLPDSIICQILQFLPTKNIIATTILSKRWNSIFPFAYPPINLDLDDSLLLRPVENAPDPPMTSFRDFMDKLLFVTLRNVSGLEGMTLKCTEDYGDKDIVSWVSAALQLNVRNLVLDIFLYKPKTLFSRLNGCTTLVSLELVMSCELLIPDNFSLPSLRRLYLSELGFRDFDGTRSINELINSCPMLEELEMVHCEMGGVFRLSIWSPMLKVLSITKSWIYADETELEIHAPNLERFMFDDYVAGGALFATFNSLFEAYIDVGTINEQVEADDVLDGDWNIYADVVRIIAACSNTKNLYLSEYAILSLHYAPLQLPQFQNLILLVLGSVRSEGWMILAGLLCNAPNLERLTFTEEFKQSETWFADFERLVSTPPVCLERHMKYIDIRDFEGNDDEFKLLNYFLQYAKVLEEVQLGCSTKMNVNARYRLFMMEHNTKIVVVQSANK